MQELHQERQTCLSSSNDAKRLWDIIPSKSSTLDNTERAFSEPEGVYKTTSPAVEKPSGGVGSNCVKDIGGQGE